MTYARTSSLLARASGLSGTMHRNSCLVEAMVVVENALVNDRLRKTGESLVKWNMSVDEVGEKVGSLKYLLFWFNRSSTPRYTDYFALKPTQPRWVGSAWG